MGIKHAMRGINQVGIKKQVELNQVGINQVGISQVGINQADGLTFLLLEGGNGTSQCNSTAEVTALLTSSLPTWHQVVGPEVTAAPPELLLLRLIGL